MIMNKEKITGLIKFFKEAEALKRELRTAWLSNGKFESVADHSWRMSLMAMCLINYEKGLDTAKILKMCLVHDLGEAYEGDVSAINKEDKEIKFHREEQCMNKLLENVEPSIKEELLNIWIEYNDGLTPEAKFVRAVDKFETLIQHNQGLNPDNFDYSFNLEYGREWTDYSELFSEIRKVIDDETEGKFQQ